MSAQSRHWSVFGEASVILVIAAAVWLAWYCAAVAAMKPVAGMAPAASAPPVPTRAERMHVSDEPMRARLERLSEREMKAFYARCSAEGVERRLDGGEAMACSIGYDVLLNKHFEGDFERLLRWSRSERTADMR